jgi:putative spermidine/putrescine transport system ATP-binding protein
VEEAVTAAVALDAVHFAYPGTRAGIFDLSLEIAPGELVVCIGPSGCGKTTLLRLIAGFLKPDRGSVRLAGVDVTHASVRERECGVVFQSYALFPHMRVWENVAYPLRVRGEAVETRRRRATEMLGLVGLADFADRLPAQLSGGQQQRVALARALVFRPRALLLDEPLSALDAATRVTMRDEIRRIQKSQGIASMLITHDQDEALSLADRVVVLKEGRLVQAATPHALYDRPADAFVATFVGRANLLPGTVRSADSVECALGTLATGEHGERPGAEVLLLVRPERIELADDAHAPNTMPVVVRNDRFFGATRRLALAAGDALLEMETLARGDVRQVHVPREAIQFLPAGSTHGPDR